MHTKTVMIFFSDNHLGNICSWCRNSFLNVMAMNDIGKRAHGLKHSHGRCVVGAFDKILHEGFIWT